jgi:hypothetical protein
MDETGGEAPTKTLQLSGKAVCGAEKQPSSSLKKSIAISDCVVQVPLESLNKKGLHIIFFFLIFLSVFYVFLFFLVSFM